MPRLRHKKSVLLGVCPMGKFVFSHEDALFQKKRLFARLDELGVQYCNLDSVLPESDGLIREQAHTHRAIQYFREQGIDALFLPHCNFGTEGAAGMIARELALPTLLWGPRDGPPLPDGSRLRD